MQRLKAFLLSRMAFFFVGTTLAGVPIGVVLERDVLLGGPADFKITGDVTYAPFEWHQDIEMDGAVEGFTPPTDTTINPFRCKTFDALNERIYPVVEIAERWDGVTNPKIIALLFTEAGDPLGNGEVISFRATYRSIDASAGEAYDKGTPGSAFGNVTGVASEPDKGSYKLTIELDDANQPFAPGDHVGFRFERDVGQTDSYSGAVYVCLMHWAQTITSRVSK